LQATIEELETSNEELQATNEEMLASNEELQSTNEELHSVNEELYTVNAEYQKKIEEQTELTQDMHNLLKSTEVHTIFLDEELRIRKFTPKMAEVFNLIASDVGRRIHGFVHTIQSEDLPDKLASVLEYGTLHEEEVCDVDGNQFLMRILPYQGNGGLSGVVMTLIDITVLKVAESQFNNAVEVSPNGMLMINRDGQITRVNTELEKIFGYSREELIGQPLQLLMPSETADHHIEFQEDFFRDPRSVRRMGPESYVWGLRKNGQRIPIDVRVDPIQTPTGIQAIASLVDITEHEQLETSLRDQVAQRDHFLATLSHELRNPMAAILTAASVLDRFGEMSSELQRPVAIIRRQATQIATLLDDLLDVARVTQGKITLRIQPADLVEVCRESIEAVEPLATMHRHELVLRAEQQKVWSAIDRVRILQSIENLLTNACKYTPDGGTIEVLVGVQDNQAVIRVRDNGCGMSPELLANVFDMFVQSDDTLDRSEGGMGVGLTLVRSLVELHQGTIEASSAGPDRGSEFVIRLPLTHNQPCEGSSGSNSQICNDGRIVLVEDNHDAREMMEKLLNHEGFQVVATAADGAEGFEAIMRERPSFGLLDIGLPKLDGYQLARKLRSELGQSIRLIALTGYGRDEDHEAVLQAGFDGHLVKPVTIAQLREILTM
jgi:two-component system CheB/CheR fusion protein